MKFLTKLFRKKKKELERSGQFRYYGPEGNFKIADIFNQKYSKVKGIKIIDKGKKELKFIPLEDLIVGSEYIYVSEGSLGFYTDDHTEYIKNCYYHTEEVVIDGVYLDRGSVHYIVIEHDQLIKKQIDSYGETWGFRYVS